MNYYCRFAVLLIAACLHGAAFAGMGEPVWEGAFPSTGTGKELGVKVYVPDKESRGTIPSRATRGL